MATAATPATETRRDRWGRYLVVPPGGGKPVGYTRATTITKTLDDTNSLIPWAGVTGTVGALSRPGLTAAWQALIAEHGPNPWYGGDDAKRRAKALFEECKEAGGASDRATLGTALHALVERINKGQPVTGVSADIAADLAAYTATLAAAGIVVHPDYCERIVVLDEWKVAGTADALAVTVPGYAKPLTADLKTGAEVKWSLLAIAMQLAIYNHADAMYQQGADPSGKDDQRLPMPDVDRDHALIIHLPAGEARCELHIVNTR